ncbi:hypothetical protein HHK36_016683 [Tetracentron sinense]|uniref:K Homology domain-containing protein n=1 Tax=Tetracentron sinense TaxID=13715 RepID=A0A834Z5Q1_TETSI|nr:hypothetical protein HHK36_016683 [Tetracentron sinense]
MESPESSYISSPEAPPKRSAILKSPISDDKEKSTYIRFLVSNAAAGSVIGKGGSTITEFQSKSGSRIQLSHNHEFFPGTSDRIIMISGAFDEIISAMELILAKLHTEIRGEDGDEVDPRSKVRLIVPNSSCGGIIGKGGATIKILKLWEGCIGNGNGIRDCDNSFRGCWKIAVKREHQKEPVAVWNSKGSLQICWNSRGRGCGRLGGLGVGCGSDRQGWGDRRQSFIEDSQAGIKISPQDNNYTGLNDRLVTLTGSLEEEMRAIFLILSKLTEDVHYSQSMNVPFSYAGYMVSALQKGLLKGVVKEVNLKILKGKASNGISAEQQRSFVVYRKGPAGFEKGIDRAFELVLSMTPLIETGDQMPEEDRGNLVTIGVADEHIGVVLGRGGRNIMEISQACNSEMLSIWLHNFVSGTSDRKVTITGSQVAIRTAEAMIIQKAASASER